MDDDGSGHLLGPFWCCEVPACGVTSFRQRRHGGDTRTPEHRGPQNPPPVPRPALLVRRSKTPSRALHHLFSECSGSLTTLLLDTVVNKPVGTHEQISLFSAVSRAQVHSLRELHMPGWLGVMSNNAHDEVCDPLRSFSGLKVCVPNSLLEDSRLKDRFPFLDFRGTK